MDKVINYLNENYLERNDVVDGILTAIIAKENCLLIGTPGTAKTDILKEVGDIITQSSFFKRLLSKFSVPEHLFGALVMKDFEHGIHRYNTDKMLPKSNIALLDEFYKASGEILETLLKIMEERKFDNGNIEEDVPIWTIFGASNELPDIVEDTTMDAVDDRFVLRFMVKEISEDANLFKLLKFGLDKSKRPSISFKEIEALQAKVNSVVISDEILETLIKIKADMSAKGITASTRRWVKSIKMLKAYAVLKGSSSVDMIHLKILSHVLWRQKEHEKEVSSIINRYALDQFTQKLDRFLEAAKECDEMAQKRSQQQQMGAEEMKEGAEQTQKVKKLLKDLDELKASNPNKVGTIEAYENQIRAIQKNIAAIYFSL